MPKSHIEFFENAVEKTPDDSFVRYSLAMEYRKADRLDDALATFDALIERDPEYVAAYQMAAEVAIALQKIEHLQSKLDSQQNLEAAREEETKSLTDELARVRSELEDRGEALDRAEKNRDFLTKEARRFQSEIETQEKRILRLLRKLTELKRIDLQPEP